MNNIILNYKIKFLYYFSNFIGIYLFIYSIIRLFEKNYFIGSLEFIFSLYLFISSYYLNKNNTLYNLFAKSFFVLIYILFVLVFLNMPNERTIILWIPTILVFIYFLLDKKAGLLFLILYLIFIVYLYYIKYFNHNTEYITLIISIIGISLVMHYYEKIKELDNTYKKIYTRQLKLEISDKTKKLNTYNSTLSKRINDEMQKVIEYENYIINNYYKSNTIDVISKLSHEIRQPLMLINSILLNTNQENLDDKIDELATITSILSNKLENIDFICNNNNKKYNICDLINNIKIILKDELENINFKINCRNNILIQYDKNYIMNLIIILLTNIVKMINHKNNNSIQINVTNLNNLLKINIIIYNFEIKKEQISTLFDLSYTEQISDDGFGFYMVKTIIEHKLNGSIRVSNISNSLNFFIELRL